MKHHSHLTGKHHSSLRNDYNIQINLFKCSFKIPVFIHNLNYAEIMCFDSLYNYEILTIMTSADIAMNKMKIINFTLNDLNMFILVIRIDCDLIDRVNHYKTNNSKVN